MRYQLRIAKKPTKAHHLDDGLNRTILKDQFFLQISNGTIGQGRRNLNISFQEIERIYLELLQKNKESTNLRVVNFKSHENKAFYHSIVIGEDKSHLEIQTNSDLYLPDKDDVFTADDIPF